MTLKLTIEKGPLAGRINEYKPGSVISIGRVIRGNNLTIKDPGISTKHLVIQSNSSTDQWTITDLGSSNGTILNDTNLDPSQPVILATGDVIKIGGKTSMRVDFEVEPEPSRRSKRVSELGLDLDDNKLGVVGKNEGDKSGEDNVVQKKGKGGRPPRTKAGDLKVEGKKVEDAGNSEKTTQGQLEVPLVVDKEKHEKIASGVEAKENVSVRTRRSNRGSNLDVIENQRVSPRRTRSSRKEDICLVDLDMIESKRRGKGARGKSKLTKEPPLEEENDEELKLDNEVHQEKKMESVVGEKERESATASASTSGTKKGGDGVSGGNTLKKLEEMTLGEWLDFLEASLPKQIIESTEEMISEMGKKSERVHELRLKHTNPK